MAAEIIMPMVNHENFHTPDSRMLKIAKLAIGRLRSRESPLESRGPQGAM